VAATKASYLAFSDSIIDKQTRHQRQEVRDFPQSIPEDTGSVFKAFPASILDTQTRLKSENLVIYLTSQSIPEDSGLAFQYKKKLNFPNFIFSVFLPFTS
jgi:hypothetical protein